MQNLKWVVIKNALANVVRGGASSVVALVLPHFLTHSLSVDRYAAWVLMLQIAAYANYLDFGLQTAVARYLAQAIERGDAQRRDRVVSTAFALLAGAAAVVLILALVVVWRLPHLFTAAPVALIGELRAGVLILSASAAFSLPLSTFTGVLVGLHRNEYPALAIGSSRLLGAACVLFQLHFTNSLIWLSLGIAGFNLLGGVVQLVMVLRLAPDMHADIRNVERTMTSELLKYCAGLTVFSFAMLLVNGLDVTIVGYFAFAAAGYYGIAATVIGFVTGLSGAIYSALMAPLAVLQERKDTLRIEKLILRSTRLGSYVSLGLLVFIVLAGKSLLTLWVGLTYAEHAYPILVVLICAQAIRLSGSGYSVALVATGQQKHGAAGAIVEGITNLAGSILGARYFGPIGVAWGTLAGAICGIMWVVFYTMRHATGIVVPRRKFAREAIVWPVTCFTPLLIYLALRSLFGIGLTCLPLLCLCSAILLLWRGALPFNGNPKDFRVG